VFYQGAEDIDRFLTPGEVQMTDSEHTTARRHQILEAATTVFSQFGLYQARMEDIAAAAGVSKGTIYLYFKDKDSLIQALAEQIFAQELANLQLAYNTAGTAVERLTIFYETLIAEEAEVLPLMPILYEFYALGLRREDVRVVLSNFLNQSATLLAAIIQEGIESGEFAPTDALKAARALDALMSGIILQWVYAQEEMDVNAQLRYSVQLIFQGLLNHT